MKNNKFIVDLSSVTLTHDQINLIQSGIEKVISNVLIDNAAYNSKNLHPITDKIVKEMPNFSILIPFLGWIYYE
jgi:hypothetical protein